MNRISTSRYPARCPFIDRGLGLAGAIWISLVLLFAVSCSRDDGQEDPESGKLVIRFEHHLDGVPLVFDTLIYQNAAGNPYLVNEIQYFISDVRLFRNDGSVKLIDDWKAIHYVDTDIPSTHSWEVYDPIPPGSYDSMTFTFGISPERNNSYMYVNPPEKDMFWPEFLGGGYHYLKLNGKWLPEGQTFQTIPFDFHLGIGQVYYSYPDSITGYVHNNFDVSLPGSDFLVSDGLTTELVLIMQVDQWFMDPNLYDHDVYGGYIMQNQEAMEKVKENGHNVFIISKDGKE